MKRKSWFISSLLLMFALGGLTSFIHVNHQNAQATTTPELNGWDYDFNNGASGSVTTTGAYITVQVNDAGTADWHAKLARYSQSIESNHHYRWTVVMKSSTAVKMNFLMNAVGSGMLSENWNIAVGTTYQSYVYSFTANMNHSNVEYLMQYGGSWAENKAGPFTLSIEKLLIEKVNASTLYSEDFSVDNGGYTSDFYDGAAGSLTYDNTNDNLAMTITNFGLTNPWNIHLRKLTSLNVTSGHYYRVSFDVTTTHDKHFEFGIEDDRYSYLYRAGFLSGLWTTSTTNVTFNFLASQSLSNIALHFQLGGNDTAPTTITFDNIVFAEYLDDIATTNETRVGKYASEFADTLNSYDTCVASTENGYLAVPSLYEDHYLRLIDASNLTTEYVTDYDYTFGGSGPKVENAVTALNKWVAMVQMYNANRGENPEISLFNPTIEPPSSSVSQSNLSMLLSIGIIAFAALTFYYFLQKKETLN